MEYANLGHTDIKVSKLCIGAMSFGKPGTMHDWSLDYPADIDYLEELYTPHEIRGAIAHNPAAGTVLIDEKK